MLKKRKTRELAMQLLFLWDSNGEPDTVLADQCLRDSGADAEVCRGALAMASGAWEQRGLIEARVERLAPNGRHAASRVSIGIFCAWRCGS